MTELHLAHPAVGSSAEPFVHIPRGHRIGRIEAAEEVDETGAGGDERPPLEVDLSLRGDLLEVVVLNDYAAHASVVHLTEQRGSEDGLVDRLSSGVHSQRPTRAKAEELFHRLGA